MTLSKKHFIAIAEILGNHKADISQSLINDFCDYFKSENGLFDSYTFSEFINKVYEEKTEKQI